MRWGDGEMGRWGDGEMGRETGFLRVLCLGTRNILRNPVYETIDEGRETGFLRVFDWVHLIFKNILVGAKHFGSKSLIITHKLYAEMLRPGQNEMHPFNWVTRNILRNPVSEVTNH
jgi:hypothetical protein